MGVYTDTAVGSWPCIEGNYANIQYTSTCTELVVYPKKWTTTISEKSATRWSPHTITNQTKNHCSPSIHDTVPLQSICSKRERERE